MPIAAEAVPLPNGVDLRTIVAQVSQRMHGRMDDAPVCFSIPASETWVAVDVVLLRDVVEQIFHHALRYPVGGEGLRLCVERNGALVSIVFQGFRPTTGDESARPAFLDRLEQLGATWENAMRDRRELRMTLPCLMPAAAEERV